VNWIYQGRELTDSDLEKQYGFIYLITNLSNNRKYIGRKYLTKSGYKVVNGKRKRTRKESDWKSYFGSNEELKNDVVTLGEESFSREILHFCKTRGHCNYLELREIIDRRALESDQYYNAWVSARVHKTHLKNLNS